MSAFTLYVLAQSTEKDEKRAFLDVKEVIDVDIDAAGYVDLSTNNHNANRLYMLVCILT